MFSGLTSLNTLHQDEVLRCLLILASRVHQADRSIGCITNVLSRLGFISLTPCSSTSERLMLGGVSAGLQPEEIQAKYANECQDANQDPHSDLLFQRKVGAAL
jgi:hypothetical protein